MSHVLLYYVVAVDFIFSYSCTMDYVLNEYGISVVICDVFKVTRLSSVTYLRQMGSETTIGCLRLNNIKHFYMMNFLTKWEYSLKIAYYYNFNMILIRSSTNIIWLGGLCALTYYGERIWKGRQFNVSGHVAWLCYLIYTGKKTQVNLYGLQQLFHWVRQWQI